MRVWVPTFFATCLFFLCCADEVFTTRAFGVNLRWGQLLLLVGALSLLPRAWNGMKSRAPDIVKLWPLFAAWGLFFACYGISVSLSDAPIQSGIKLVWGIFNIAGAAAIGFLSPRPSTALRDGFVAACLIISGIIWIDAIAIYWMGTGTPVIGLAQVSYSVGEFQTLRPHAFYYEPSYAGAWLAIAVPLMTIALVDRPRWVRALIPAVSLSAVFLVSARTGILSAFMALFLIVAVATIRRQWELTKSVASIVVLATALLSVFFLSKDARQYGLFILGPLGPSETISRLTKSEPSEAPQFEAKFVPEEEPEAPKEVKAVIETKYIDSAASQTSEGARIASYIHALEAWKDRPLFGTGAAQSDKGNSLIAPVAMNTWLEVLSESGLVGFLAFLLAIGLSLRTVLRDADKMAIPLLVGVWVAHLAVNLNLTQTFPRLDYWLLLFAAFNYVPRTQSTQGTVAPAEASKDINLTPCSKPSSALRHAAPRG